MVMMATNLVVIPAQNANGYGQVLCTQVDICTECGGLFARPGSQFFGTGHSH